MSYSAADFVNDCESMCDDFAVPEVRASDLPDCDPEADEGDALRLLAERIGRGLYQAQEMRECQPELVAALADYVDQTTRYINDRTAELPNAVRARKAIKAAQS